MDLEQEKKKYEMNREMTNMLLEVMGGDKYSPMCFKVLRAEKKVHDKTFDLLHGLTGEALVNNNDLKSLLIYFEQGEKIINDIEKKIKKGE